MSRLLSSTYILTFILVVLGAMVMLAVAQPPRYGSWYGGYYPHGNYRYGTGYNYPYYHQGRYYGRHRG